MPANFPTSPSVGQRHTISDKTWEWTGAVWDLVVSTNTLQFSGEDSTVISLNLTANEELRIVGDGSNITTTGSAGDSTNSTLQISLSKDIDINSISSTDSTAVTINDGLNVAGTLSADVIDTNVISSSDSTAVVINDDLIPGAHDTYSLGSPLRQWSNLFVTGSTIYLGDIVLKATGSGSSAKLQVLNKVDGKTATDIDLNTDYNQPGTTDTTDIADVLTVVGDDSTGATLNSHDTIKFQGDTNLSVTIDDDSSVGTTIVNTRLNDTISLAGDLTVSGNLTVSGTTTYVETANTKVSDPLLLLNNGNSGGSDIDAGIMIERGSAGNNAVFYWNEGDDVFKAVTTTSGEDASAITDTALANVRVAEPSNSSDAATKNYVDTEIAGLSTTIKFSDDASTVLTADLQNDTVTLTGGNSITSSIQGDAITVALDKSIDVNTISSGDSTAVTINDGLIVTGAMSFDGGVAVNTILDEDTFSSNSATALATQQSIKSYVDAQLTGGGALVGTNITLGTPTDSSTYPVGAISTLTTSHTITDSIDDLNEALENVRNNTFVKSVDFTANVTSGGAGTAVTLTISVTGNANRYDITWGDGDVTIGTADSTPTHTYATNVGSPFDVTVRAYNSGGEGTGSEAEETKANYITIFTATPVVTFDLYRSASGGSALSGNDLYVIEGNSLYMDNNTTNIDGATVDYTMAWGDGSSNDAIANDSAAGGTQGARLQHTWSDGTATSTSRDTLTLTLNNHSTALPADIPATGSVTLKVYDDAIAAPNGLSTKTLPAVSSVGTNARLASGFTDNTGGSSLSAGDTVNRVTSGTAEAGPITTFAYDASSGTLTANVNGSGDGNTTLTAGDDSGTYTSLVITEESDYNLLDATGASTTFAASIYHPNLYKGFKAKVSKSVASLSTGANSYQLSHSATGSTNTVEFVKDDLTATPTVNVGSTSLTENVAGTYRYISGIPYYNSGSPSLTLAGVTIDDLVGQCYTNQSNIVEVDDGANQEGTASNAITNTDYTYANIDGASTMLNGGIPTVNVGTASAYAIGNLTVPITSSSVRTVSRIKVRARNVNGVSSYSSDIATNIAVHTAAQSGVVETGVAVSDSLGAGYDDDAVRIFDFSAATTDTPSYNNATNFYTNNTYSESSDPGVTGTQEATVRMGVMQHDVTDYSTGYLPQGPDRSSDTGTQYYTMAFRRTTMANFTITLTGTVSGCFIAAPGTAIDSASSLNGWLDASVTYGGSGVPGANTGSGGNGSNGCAFTSGDRIIDGTAYSNQSFTLTLGSENATNATGNVVMIRFKLNSGDSISAVSIS